MNFRAVISDFDGTLTGEGQSMTPRVAEAIKQTIAKGTVFTIATGRMFYGVVEKGIEGLGITAPVIVRGGAEIMNPVTRETLWIKYIEDEIVRAIITKILETERDLVVEQGDKLFGRVTNEEWMRRFDYPIDPLESLVVKEIPKLVSVGAYGRFTTVKLIDELQEMFPEVEVTLTGTEPWIGFDINPAGVTKHLAVLEWEKMMKIPRKEILGIGDSFNDYGLLEACGYKVAMGNARQELKDMADWVAPALDEDGAAAVLEKFILNPQPDGIG